MPKRKPPLPQRDLRNVRNEWFSEEFECLLQEVAHAAQESKRKNFRRNRKRLNIDEDENEHTLSTQFEEVLSTITEDDYHAG